MFSAAANKIGGCEIQIHTDSNAGSIGSTSGTLSYTTMSNSIAKFAIGNGTQTITTDGYVIHSGLLAGQDNIMFSSNDYETLLTRAIVGRFDTLYVVVFCNTNGTVMCSSLDFIESL